MPELVTIPHDVFTLESEVAMPSGVFHENANIGRIIAAARNTSHINDIMTLFNDRDIQLNLGGVIHLGQAAITVDCGWFEATDYESRDPEIQHYGKIAGVAIFSQFANGKFADSGDSDNGPQLETIRSKGYKLPVNTAISRGSGELCPTLIEALDETRDGMMVCKMTSVHDVVRLAEGTDRDDENNWQQTGSLDERLADEYCLDQEDYYGMNSVLDIPTIEELIEFYPNY